MASKKFYRWALTLNVLTALLSVLFSFILFKANNYFSAGEGMIIFVFYVKKFFDLLAVFTGLGSIMYAFCRYDFVCGVKTVGIFSISVLLSLVWQVFGSYIDFGGDFIASEMGGVGISFVMLTICYACGYCFITQFVPALIVGFCSHFIAKQSTNKKTLLKLRLIATSIVLVINLALVLLQDVLPFLKEMDYLISKQDLKDIIWSFVEAFVIYGPIQFAMYYLTHYLYSRYTDKTLAATHDSKKKKKSSAGKSKQETL